MYYLLMQNCVPQQNFQKNIVEEIRDLTANDIGQILWGHWVEIGDIGQTLGKLGRNWGLG